MRTISKLIHGLFVLVSLGYGNATLAQTTQATSWVKRIGGTGQDEPAIQAISHDALGNVYSLGVYSAGNHFLSPGDTMAVNNTGGYDAFVLKSDSLGNVIWLKQIATTTAISGIAPVYPYALDADANGNVYITGSYSRGTVDFDPGPGIALGGIGNNGGQNMFILKLNTAGNYQWHKEFRDTATNASSVATGRAIKVDASGNIYAASYFKGNVFFALPNTSTGVLQSTGTNNNTAILKLNPAGNFIWVKHFSTTGSSNSNVFDMDVDDSGNIYTVGDITGLATDQIDFNPSHSTPSGSSAYASAGSNDIFISKLDPNGNYVWSKVIGGTSAEYCYGVAVNANGVHITGGFHSASINVNFDPGNPNAPLITSSGTQNIYVAKYSLAGTLQWVKQFGGAGNNENGRDVALSTNGDIYVTGTFAVTTTDFDPLTPGTQAIAAFGSTDAFLLKLNSSGDFKWVVGMGAPGATASNERGAGITMYATGSRRSIYTVGVIANASLTTPAVFPVNFDGSTTPATTLSSAGGLDIFLHRAIEDGCTPTSSSITDTACGTYTVGSNTYNQSGTYTITLLNSAGCDSVITLNLTIHPTATSNFTHVACDSFEFGGQTYYQSGNYTHTFNTINGCDSIVTVFLAIGAGSNNSITATACNSFSFGGHNYNQSGSYTDTFQNAVGCDSIVTLNLTINTVNVNVSQSGSTLTAQASGATYQWINCATNTAVAGAVQQSFTPASNGSYAVIVTENNCSDTSTCFNVETVSIKAINKDNNILAVYPNPVNYLLNLASTIAGSVTIHSIDGRVILTKTIRKGTSNIDVTGFVQGVYFIKVYDLNGILQQVLKVTKK